MDLLTMEPMKFYPYKHDGFQGMTKQREHKIWKLEGYSKCKNVCDGVAKEYRTLRNQKFSDERILFRVFPVVNDSNNMIYGVYSWNKRVGLRY